MGQVFSEDTIYRVKQAADIVDVISRYVPLKKAGRYFKAKCPFHGDEDPSFTVSPERQMFHCFGCQEGGDVIAFLMKYQNLSFMEAVQDLAERYRVTLPKLSGESQRASREEERERAKLFRVNELAREFFVETLTSRRGAKAREYLTRRNIDAGVREQFFLGFAEQGWDHLLTYMKSRNVPLDLVEKAGLIIRKSGGFYDRFRERIIFPIVDLRGKTIGFGGRTLTDETPKYLNSPETPLYHKGRSLYGMNAAVDAARAEGYAIIVEGYMDAISLVAHGVRNVVATLGTALTNDQVRLVKRMATRAVLAFDSDEAGRKAALRNAPQFFSNKMEVTVLSLPGDHDPDDYINREGRDAFLKKIDESKPLSDFCLDTFLGQGVDTIAGQTAAIEAFKPIYTVMPNELEKSRCVKILAERLQQDEAVVGKMLGSRNAQVGPALEKQRPASVSSLERFVFSFFARNPRVGPALREKGVTEFFEDRKLAELLQDALRDYETQGSFDIGRFTARHTDPAVSALLSETLVSANMEEKEDVDQILDDILHTFERRSLNRRAGELQAQIETAEKNNDLELLQALLHKKKILIRERAEVYEKRGYEHVRR